MEFIPKREIIHAVQWYPGSDPSIIECTRDGETFGLLKGPEQSRWGAMYIYSEQAIYPGDYLETNKETGERTIHLKQSFEEKYVARSRFNPNVRISLPVWSIHSPE